MKSLLETSTLKVVLLTQCDKQTIPPERRFDLMRTLLEKGHSVTCTPGEGDVAPHDRNELLVLSEAEDRTSGELEKDNTHVHIRDISGLEPESVVQLVEDLQEETKTYKNREIGKIVKSKRAFQNSELD